MEILHVGIATWFLPKAKRTVAGALCIVYWIFGIYENNGLEPPAFITVICCGFMLILLFALILSIYIYCVS